MSAPLLQLRGIQKTYARTGGLLPFLGDRASKNIFAVDGIDLDIGAGETLALVGESGSGKTTTGRIVALLEKPTRGRVIFDGRDVTALVGAEQRAHRRAVQIIFQNPYEAFDPRLTIGAAVAEPLRLQKIGTAREWRAKAEELLVSVDLRPASAFLDRYPSDLSGGQLQRASIARALALSPRLLVADEPVSMLDVSVRAGVMLLLLDLQEKRGLSCLFITHDLAVARTMSRRIAVMRHGRIVEQGDTDEIIAEPKHSYTKQLLEAVPEYRVSSPLPF